MPPRQSCLDIALAPTAIGLEFTHYKYECLELLGFSSFIEVQELRFFLHQKAFLASLPYF